MKGCSTLLFHLHRRSLFTYLIIAPPLSLCDCDYPQRRPSCLHLNRPCSWAALSSSFLRPHLCEALTPALEQAMKGCSALIIATSAVPAPQPPPPGAPPGPPVFLWKENQAPEQVDWLAQKAQVDAAKAAGVGHVVIISSMGGCDPNHPLNKIANGNILQVSTQVLFQMHHGMCEKCCLTQRFSCKHKFQWFTQVHTVGSSASPPILCQVRR
ncbi:hypothetical protein DUNSADRAFT_5584 [Dunaliella salina]|uniref:Uncharacterized protein n=1 Tax=Dunaliella salina TaxID=3046 RepID=A0ABQ7FU79_DUNSA|nr:hypothetical protein DUNSADRAFT_5584 [Dunaliella salina]|eukprot:KAF5825981.1 hypothetical protein DUNSADRAFT_5584 [Dunaliella salina]